MVHAQVVRDEDIGVSDGTPAQRFPLQRRPVVPWDEPGVLQVIDDDRCHRLDGRSSTSPTRTEDDTFHIDPFAGEVQFGPAVRQADGTLRQYGAVPPKGAHLRLAVYRTGGGVRGNVATGQVRVLKTSVPYVARVENRTPAVGGARGEDIEDAKLRGPLVLRSRGPGRHRRGLRGAGPAGRPGGRPGALRRRRRRRCRGCWWCRTSPADDVGRIRREDLIPLPESLGPDQRPTSTSGGWSAPGWSSNRRTTSGSPRWSASGPGPGTAPRTSAKRCCGRCTGSSTRWTAGRTATAGRSGGSVQAHEVHAALARDSRAWTWPRRSASSCSRPTRPPDARGGGAAVAAGAHRAGLLLRAPGAGPAMTGTCRASLQHDGGSSPAMNQVPP